MIEDINEPDPIEIIVKPSRGERLKRSVSARLRRKEVKQIKSVHQMKLEKEAEKKLKKA